MYMQQDVYSKILSSIMNGDNKTTKMHLRLSSASFRKIVTHIPKKRHGWSVEYEVICFLYWMACGCSYRVVAGFLGISRFTARNVIHKTLKEIIAMRGLIRHGTAEENERVADKFCQKTKSNAFRNFVGAIDGTHIRIKCPVNKHDEYINHKRFYSIQAQAVVDSDYKFTDVFIGYPGSVHDTRVFVNSPLYARGDYPPRGQFLFGDKGYPCQTFPVAVITPFKEPLTSNQARFNVAHSRGRIVVEAAFGILKNRWRNIFNRDLELKIENCIKTVFAAFILHNICILADDFDLSSLATENETINIESVQSARNISDSEDGLRVRNEILNEFLQTI
ncbi:protein ALP1-like [Rhagoletis pomonella]|uniref:protein ALP1-like n=1 Tax=Rhagoletis pomonella TaxID=28610 RepID=UPI001783229C|nr:protein ALP1-like [Rhagoletis pomonella]